MQLIQDYFVRLLLPMRLCFYLVLSLILLVITWFNYTLEAMAQTNLLRLMANIWKPEMSGQIWDLISGHQL